MANISLLEMRKTKKRNVREAIISVLGRKFPLSIKKIFFEINKEYKLGVTYQAVFKLINEMLEENILVKSNREYKLNINWINRLENELAIIKKNYVGEDKKSDTQIQDRINEFIAVIGPKLKEYLDNDKSCIITLSGTGYYYALNLWKYLLKEGIDVKFMNLNKTDLTAGKRIKFNKEDFQNRKVLIVDYGIFSGSIYKLLMDVIKPLKNKFKIIDIKFIVDIDLVGLADFSVVKTSSLSNTRVI
ncbi:hypothetical protein FJZ19_02325 [Candidatus Pacearchaeota archaeon]|nr:hypothetical protein [Candidatus Pacearchaeota archaeon]